VPRLRAHSAILLPLAIAGSLASFATLGAEDAPEQKLRSVEQQLNRSRAEQEGYAKQAEALAIELATLRADAVSAAEAARAHETALSDLEIQLAALTADEWEKTLALAHQREREAQLLIALERLSLNPPEALAFGPVAPNDAIRSGILLGAAVPRLEEAARALRAQLAELQTLRDTIRQRRESVEGERRGLQKEQSKVQELVARKSELRDRALQGAEKSGQRLAQLSAQAGDLKELIERLEAERKAREEAAQRESARQEAERQARLAALPRVEPAPTPGQAEVVTAPNPVRVDPTKPKTIRPFAKARGAMVFPVSGTLVLRYGEPNQFGVSNKGLTLATRPGAIVVAPFDGQIEFAGPFQGYGQILIIQHGDGYHSLLAGLDRIDGAVGEWLVAGEPVGAMASTDPKPRLYLELRHNGQPINPLPWLATRDEKVSG
jgi:murein hydrolase activator